MEKRIIFATGNEGKMREVRMILEDLEVPVVSRKEAGVSADIEENGTTFEENAVIKARSVMELTGEMAMADDSGLEIDYLDGAPGIYSARFMGEDTSYDIKNAALIEKLAGVPDEKRTARFVCAIACVMPDGTTLTSRGTMEGIFPFPQQKPGRFDMYFRFHRFRTSNPPEKGCQRSYQLLYRAIRPDDIL